MAERGAGGGVGGGDGGGVGGGDGERAGPVPGSGREIPARDNTRVLTGIGVSPGLRAGPVRTMFAAAAGPPPPVVAGRSREAWPGGDREAERLMATEALHAVAEDLRERGRRAAASGNRDAQDVLDAQALMATDPVLAQEIAARTEAGVNAAQAVYDVFAGHRETLAGAGHYLAGRVADLDDIRDRTVARLLGRPMPHVPESDRPFVLVAVDLAPAETAVLDPAKVIAFVTEHGGPTSHSAILARSMGIPAVVGCAGCREISDGTIVIVDGATGQVVISPPQDETRTGGSWAHGRRPPTWPATESAPAESVEPTEPAGPAGPAESVEPPPWPAPPTVMGRPGTTSDGRRIALRANIGGSYDVDAAVAHAAEGVGLLRTEFLFLDRPVAPSVDEQEDAYRRIFERFPQQRVVVRVLDVGADKPLGFLPPPGHEANPALGRRGLRMLREHPGVLADQLTALSRAADGLPVEVAVMAPMVSDIEEARAFAAGCGRLGLGQAGIMIEVPSAALRARDLINVVDFVSIGTNDLAQYTFAADRQASWAAHWHDPWQPALLDLIAITAAAAVAAGGRECGVCGEAAADPALACVLAGLGATSLSMGALSLAAVRSALAAHTFEQCREAARAARAATDATAARAAAYAQLPGLWTG